MPHLFVNRPRLHRLGANPQDRSGHARWEKANAAAYTAGGVIFIMGSALFFPALSAWTDWGVSLFLIGSLIYLVVTGHDLIEVLGHRRARRQSPESADLDLPASLAYVSGTVLFTVGTLFFYSAIDLIRAGAWCFFIGSLLFVLGAGLNVLQIIRARSLLTLQLMNLTAISYVVGSVLFAVASVPYLWTIHDAADQTTLYAYLASQYLIGSILFLVGGLFNAWRAAIFIQRENCAL